MTSTSKILGSAKATLPLNALWVEMYIIMSRMFKNKHLTISEHSTVSCPNTDENGPTNTTVSRLLFRQEKCSQDNEPDPTCYSRIT